MCQSALHLAAAGADTSYISARSLVIDFILFEDSDKSARLLTSEGGTSLQNLCSRKGWSLSRSWTCTMSFFRVILQRGIFKLIVTGTDA